MLKQSKKFYVFVAIALLFATLAVFEYAPQLQEEGYISYETNGGPIERAKANAVVEFRSQFVGNKIYEKDKEFFLIEGEPQASKVEVSVDGSIFACAPKMPDPQCPAVPPACPSPIPGCPCKDNPIPVGNADWGIKNILADQSKKISDGREITVCIADTGIDRNHPALAGKVLNAVSFIQGQGPEDVQGHGTHVSGTVTANDNNASGKQLSASNAKILMAKVLDNTGRGSLQGIAQGIQWCGNQPGVKVISLSLGADQPSPILAQVLMETGRKGIVTFAACGNSNRNSCSWPGKYAANVDNLWAVVATSPSNGRAAFSQWDPAIHSGSGRIIAAPGTNILSLRPGGGFQEMSGTSMATPLVASVYASMLGAGKTVFGWDTTMDPAIPRKLNALKSVRGQ